MSDDKENQTVIKDERSVQQIVVDEINNNLTIVICKDRYMCDDTNIEVELRYKDEVISTDSVTITEADSTYS